MKRPSNLNHCGLEEGLFYVINPYFASILLGFSFGSCPIHHFEIYSKLNSKIISLYFTNQAVQDFWTAYSFI